MKDIVDIHLDPSAKRDIVSVRLHLPDAGQSRCHKQPDLLMLGVRRNLGRGPIIVISPFMTFIS